MNRSRVNLACSVLGVVGLMGAAEANLLVYEGFNYTPAANGLNSRNGGTGYSAAYASTNNADVVAGSFDFTDSLGRQLVTSGNRALMDSATVGDPNGTATSIAPSRNLNPSLFAPLTDGPLYLSFMGQQTAGDYRDISLSLFVSTPNNATFSTQERLSIGHGNPTNSTSGDGSLNWGAYPIADGLLGTYSSTPASTLSLIVVRIDLNVNGDLDRFRLYVNPTLGTEPAAADVESSARNFLTSLSEINRVRMRAGGSDANRGLGASQAEFDEIRIGTKYWDVTPMVAAALPGDANYNGVIDKDDFALIDRGFAMGLGGYSNGDFNNSGAIDSADYAIINQSLQGQGGQLFPGALTAVPEPAGAMVLTVLGGLALGSRRRR